MSAFDNFDFFLAAKNKAKNPNPEETQKAMESSSEHGYNFTFFDAHLASYVFCYYNPNFTIEYLESQINILPERERPYAKYIFNLCKMDRDEFSENVEDISYQFNYPIEKSDFLKRYLPFCPYTLNLILQRYDFVSNNLRDFVYQISILFASHFRDSSPEDEEIEDAFVTMTKAFETTENFPFGISDVIDKIRRKLGKEGPRLGFNIPKAHTVAKPPVSNGVFDLTWRYVTFIRGMVLLYHPHHPNDKPFKIVQENSISALNNVKSHFSGRLPHISVEAKNGYIVHVFNKLEISQSVKLLSDKFYRDQQPVATQKSRDPKDMNAQQLTDYIHQLKSTYLDWLCRHQISDYKLYYIREVRTNNNLIDEDEDAFLFVIKETVSSLIAIYENAKEARSSILFKIPKGKLDVKVQEIHEFFSSNAVNKRDQIARGIVKDKLFQQDKYERVLHNNFSQWKTKVLHFN